MKLSNPAQRLGAALEGREKVGEWSGARLHAELDISGSWRRDIFGDTVPISEARLEDLDLSLGDLKSLDLGGMAGA